MSFFPLFIVFEFISKQSYGNNNMPSLYTYYKFKFKQKGV